MGMDLTVCPIKLNFNNDWLGHERLSFERDYDLFSQIEDIGRGAGPKVLTPKPIPGTFRWYDDDGLKESSDDCYGTPLTYVKAEEFANIIFDVLSDWNKAVVIFLCSIPPETPVVLWWC